jgi:hypothetical protein
LDLYRRAGGGGGDVDGNVSKEKDRKILNNRLIIQDYSAIPYQTRLKKKPTEETQEEILNKVQEQQTNVLK